MYETEANTEIKSSAEIPAEVRRSFEHLRAEIHSRTLLPWGEHCTECVWPTCYTTCDLYSPRQDGRCRRFVDGMVRVGCPGATSSHLLKIRFKRWGKLWAPGNLGLFPLRQADHLERRDQRIGALLYQIPLPVPVRNFATGKRYSWKKRSAVGRKPATDYPDLFIMECYNPGEQPVS